MYCASPTSVIATISGEGYLIIPAVFISLLGLAYDDDDGLLPASHATCALLGGASPICFQVASEFRMRCCGPERVTSKPPPFGAGEGWRAAASGSAKGWDQSVVM